MDRHILLVEDNKEIQRANKDMLELLGYKVTLAMNLSEARSVLEKETPDVIVLDIMLPDGSGLDFLSELREQSRIPVLLLTAMNTAEDTVTGFSTGADDYLSKPYNYKVLAARVEALLRRAGQMPEILQKDELKLDVLAMKAFLHDKDLMLTQKDFTLLLIFTQNENKVISNEYLHEKVWNSSFYNSTVALKSAVSRLRKKLAGSDFIISATRGEGYLFRKR